MNFTETILVVDNQEYNIKDLLKAVVRDVNFATDNCGICIHNGEGCCPCQGFKWQYEDVINELIKEI